MVNFFILQSILFSLSNLNLKLPRAKAFRDQNKCMVAKEKMEGKNEYQNIKDLKRELLKLYNFS
ncbi:hypothetical protein A8140_17735 [Vibrio campbellii CAIM 519 = NBRC 15631 = ATCC 25920]|nr:hypothetical protein A8140_17735 [Vibrio campbellii CAIM 519 = NBRC 15631 = ATCC 25920]